MMAMSLLLASASTFSAGLADQLAAPWLARSLEEQSFFLFIYDIILILFSLIFSPWFLLGAVMIPISLSTTFAQKSPGVHSVRSSSASDEQYRITYIYLLSLFCIKGLRICPHWQSHSQRLRGLCGRPRERQMGCAKMIGHFSICSHSYLMQCNAISCCVCLRIGCDGDREPPVHGGRRDHLLRRCLWWHSPLLHPGRWYSMRLIQFSLF